MRQKAIQVLDVYGILFYNQGISETIAENRDDIENKHNQRNKEEEKTHAQLTQNRP